MPVCTRYRWLPSGARALVVVMSWRPPAVGVALLFAAGCGPAVVETSSGAQETDSDSSVSSDGSTGAEATAGSSTSGASASGGSPPTGADGSTGTGREGSSGNATTGEGSSGGKSASEETGVEPLPEGCEDHLELVVTALSVSSDGPTWEPGETVTVNFSVFNSSGVEDNNYPSVYVEADARGVQTPMPIFTWFAIVAGDTTEGALHFTSTDALEPGTEVEFTAHVATLRDACPGVGTISTTATVQ